MAEKGSDAQMTDEQRERLEKQMQLIELAVMIEEQRTARSPASGDDPGRLAVSD